MDPLTGIVLLIVVGLMLGTCGCSSEQTAGEEGGSGGGESGSTETDIETATEEEVMEATEAAEDVEDEECTCEARVICTYATKESEPVHIVNNDGPIHINDVEQMSKLDIKLEEVFFKCSVSGNECEVDEESIHDQMWQNVDIKHLNGVDIECVNRDNSYMICTKHYGVIYFYDAGQYIKDFLDDSIEGFSEWAKTERIDNMNFLQQFIDIAKEEQLRTGVPWQVTIGQIAYESSWGEKEIYDYDSQEQSFNLFGIKYFGDLANEDKYVRSWTREKINPNELEDWRKRHNNLALHGEPLTDLGIDGGIQTIRLIQPFRRYQSYEEGIIDHSNILLDERYSDAQEYVENPFIYVSVIGLVYATETEYGVTPSTIMHDYLSWEDEEQDWEEYLDWKESNQ